jgi:hypothetical protein
MVMKSIIGLLDSMPTSITVFSQNTSDNCACASDSAHRRRYDAVFEMHPSTYSIVWIIWCTNSSPKSNSSPCSPSPWLSPADSNRGSPGCLISAARALATIARYSLSRVYGIHVSCAFSRVCRSSTAPPWLSHPNRTHNTPHQDKQYCRNLQHHHTTPRRRRTGGYKGGRRGGQEGRANRLRCRDRRHGRAGRSRAAPIWTRARA